MRFYLVILVFFLFIALSLSSSNAVQLEYTYFDIELYQDEDKIINNEYFTVVIIDEKPIITNCAGGMCHLNGLYFPYNIDSIAIYKKPAKINNTSNANDLISNSVLIHKFSNLEQLGYSNEYSYIKGKLNVNNGKYEVTKTKLSNLAKREIHYQKYKLFYDRLPLIHSIIVNLGWILFIVGLVAAIIRFVQNIINKRNNKLHVKHKINSGWIALTLIGGFGLIFLAFILRIYAFLF